MKNCDEIRNMFCEYLDKELDELESSEFESHLKDCKECRNELDETKRLMDICSDMPEEELPQDFRKGLHDRLVEEKQVIVSKQKTTYIMRKYIGICSTVAAVLVIALIIKGLPWNSPVDRQNVHSQAKTDYKKYQPEAENRAASKSPTCTSNDKANTEKIESTSKSAAKSKSQSASDYSPKSKRIVTPTAKIPASNEDRAAKSNNKESASKSSNKEADEPKQSKKASADDSVSTDIMMALDTKEADKTYQLKSISISLVSSNRSLDIEKIKSNFSSCGAELITEAADEANSGDNTELKVKVPNASYQQFVDCLNNHFSSAGIETGELNVVDVTGQIKDYQDRVNALSAAADNANNSEKDTDKTSDIKNDDELQKVQNEMNKLKNESEYTMVLIKFLN